MQNKWTKYKKEVLVYLCELSVLVVKNIGLKVKREVL